MSGDHGQAFRPGALSLLTKVFPPLGQGQALGGWGEGQGAGPAGVWCTCP